MAFKFGQLLYGRFSFQLTEDVSLTEALLIDRHVQYILLNLQLSRNRRLMHSSSEAEFNKQLQLLFAITLPLKLRHSDIIVV